MLCTAMQISCMHGLKVRVSYQDELCLMQVCKQGGTVCTMQTIRLHDGHAAVSSSWQTFSYLQYEAWLSRV